MGKTLLVYYSRTGYTASVARELADASGWDVEQIQDRHARQGSWGFVRCLFDVLSGRHPAIQATHRSPCDYAVTVLGAPVWMGRLSSPIRSYIRERRAEFGALAFFCTYGGRGAEVAARQCEALAGRPLAARLFITDVEVDRGSYWDKLGEFQRRIADLTGA